MQSTSGNVGSSVSRPLAGLRRRIGVGAFVSAALLAVTAQSAMAGAEFKLSDDATLNLGIGLRTSYTNLQNGAPSGNSGSNSFGVENSRIYMSGAFGQYLKATMNFDRTGGANGAADMRMIDGIAQFEFSEGFNVWGGRFLPPSDRANLYGPFYTSAWSYPGIASAGPAVAAGRDDGAAVWGSVADSKLAYSLGMFNGHNRVAGLSNQGDKSLYAGRLQYSFWDAETGYYRNGTYLGAKNILTLGGSYQSQGNGVGSAAAPGNLKISNIDFLLEKKLAGDYVPTLEGAYYTYSLGAVDCGSGETGAPGCLGGTGNVGGLVSGKSYLVTAALLLPGKYGWGQFQPFVRYQQFNRDVTQTTNKGTDFGLNYLIKGFNAKVSAVYTRFNDTRLAAGVQSSNQFVLGVQLQY